MKFVIYMIIGAGLSACSSYEIASYSTERIVMSSASPHNVKIDSLTAPYRRELELEMNKVIGSADQNMTVERPNSLMGQWTTDVLLAYGKDSLIPSEDKDLPAIALLNTGGLRATFPGGTITVGDIYKVMPFDNQVVALKLSVEKLAEISAYIQTTGGEPIAGFKVIKGQLILDSQNKESGYFWVITTDFLANGGDKMYFFQSAVEKRTTRKLMRDLLLQEVTAKQVIKMRLEERVQL